MDSAFKRNSYSLEECNNQPAATTIGVVGAKFRCYAPPVLPEQPGNVPTPGNAPQKKLKVGSIDKPLDPPRQNNSGPVVWKSVYQWRKAN